MFDIKIDPIVLNKLNAAFPKPVNASAKALEKYRILLLELLNEAERFGRTPFEVLSNHFTVDLRRLSQKGPHIGPMRERVHAWLSNNNLSLFEFVTKGNNITKLRSTIKLSSLVTFVNPVDDVISKLALAETHFEVDQILNGSESERCKLFESIYPDFVERSPAQRMTEYEFVPVDVASLRSYIYWISTDSKYLSSIQKRSRASQALKILRIALHAQGNYPQKIKRSEFGRTYYEGVSVQNVSKDLRRAMLGDCWEYDIRSSVIAFKLGFSNEILAHAGRKDSSRRVFVMSHWYVEKKESMIAEIVKDTFGSEEKLSNVKKIALIKEALTAIGFGASVKDVGWMTKQGAWKNPAIVEIIKNSDQRKRFLTCYIVNDFIKEQRIFDEYISEYIRSHRLDIWNSDLVKVNAVTSPSKVIAWIYQHYETIAMDAVRREICRKGHTVLASIHDAVIVKKKIGFEDLQDVIYAMQDAVHNPHLQLKGTQHDRFRRYSAVPDAGIDVRFSIDQLLRALEISFPDGLVPDNFDFNSCLIDSTFDKEVNSLRR